MRQRVDINSVEEPHPVSFQDSQYGQIPSGNISGALRLRCFSEDVRKHRRLHRTSARSRSGGASASEIYLPKTRGSHFSDVCFCRCLKCASGIAHLYSHVSGSQDRGQVGSLVARR